MKRTASILAAGLMGVSPLLAVAIPAQAAPMPSVSVTITDEPGYPYCRIAFSVSKLEPNTWYLLYINGSPAIAPDFWTDARGSYKTDGYFNVDRSAFNNTNPITTTLYLTNSGLPPIETRSKISNRCPAG